MTEPFSIEAPETIFEVHVIAREMLTDPRFPTVLAIEVLSIEREHTEGEDVPDGEVPERVLTDTLPSSFVTTVLLLDPNVFTTPTEPCPGTEEELTEVGSVGSFTRVVEDHFS